MRDSPEQFGSRRDFFRAAARYGLLGVIAAGSVLTAGRRSSEKCVNKGICGGCAVFESCGLPAALSAKAAKAGG